MNDEKKQLTAEYLLIENTIRMIESKIAQLEKKRNQQILFVALGFLAFEVLNILPLSVLFSGPHASKIAGMAIAAPGLIVRGLAYLFLSLGILNQLRINRERDALRIKQNQLAELTRTLDQLKLRKVNPEIPVYDLG